MEHSPLSAIPSELRNEIYELVLSREQPTTLSFDWTHVHSKRHRLESALTQTCKQIRSEALPVLYGTNSFYFDLGWYGSDYNLPPWRLLTPATPFLRFSQWATGSGRYCATLLRKVEIEASFDIRRGPFCPWAAAADLAPAICVLIQRGSITPLVLHISFVFERAASITPILDHEKQVFDASLTYLVDHFEVEWHGSGDTDSDEYCHQNVVSFLRELMVRVERPGSGSSLRPILIE